MFNFNLSGHQSRQEEKLRFHMDDQQGVSRLTSSLAGLISGAGTNHRLVALCIGTDRSTGDCLGPLVGSQLREGMGRELVVYGTLENPVHASNLQQTLAEMQDSYPDAFIVAIDACLGRLESVGYISLCRGSLKPGAGVHKNLPMVGEVHITGIVNVGGFMEYLVLQNTRLSVVMKMSRQISRVIMDACRMSQERPATGKI